MSVSQNFPEIEPSLLLDFANVKKLDPRITFTRASEGRFYDGQTVAKAEENLVLYSQDFSQSNWTVSNATKTSTTIVDPAGGLTALQLSKIANSSYSLRQYTAGGNPAGRTAAFSIYLKGTAGTTVRLYMDNGVDQSFVIYVTLTDTWERYSVTGTFNSTNAASTCGVGFDSTATATLVYVAFAQWEFRSAAAAYIPTTTQPITTYIPVLQTASSNVARFHHNHITGESLGLLVEEQRTNLQIYSEDFSTWTNYSTLSISSNHIVAPNGTLTGTKLIELNDTLAGPVVTNTNISVSTTPTAYTYSVYLKRAERHWAVIAVWNRRSGADLRVSRQWFNLETGTIEGYFQQNGGYANPSASIVDVGNGWYRCSFTGTTLTGDTLTSFFCNLAVEDLSIEYVGSPGSGLYIWGAQVEQGAFPTSYIPTTTSQVTRSADGVSMTGANFTDWYRADEGTLYGEGRHNNSTNYPVLCGISDATSSGNQIFLYTTSPSFGETFFVRTNNVIQVNSFSGPIASNTNFFKTIGAYKFNDFATSLNGAEIISDTSGAVPVVDRLFIGASTNQNNYWLNGTIKKIAYYPLRLSNENLEALTS